MLRRHRVLAAVALVGGVALSGCTPQDDAEREAAISAWLDDWDAAPAPADALGAGAGRASPSDPEPQQDAGVTLDFETPARLGAVEFSCSGSGTLMFSITAVLSSGTTGSTHGPHECSEGVLRLSAADLGVDTVPASSVTVNGFDASEPSAWGAVVIGD